MKTHEGLEELESVSIDGKPLAIRGLEIDLKGPRTSLDEPLCRDAFLTIKKAILGKDEWYVSFYKEDKGRSRWNP